MEGNRFNYIKAEEGMQRHELGIQIDEPTDHIQATARFVLLRTQQGTHFVIYQTQFLTYVRLFEHAFRSSTNHRPAPLMVCPVMMPSVREKN
jgi:hypothetical protein